MRSAEAAQYLGLSVWSLRRLIQRGELPVVQHQEMGKFLLDIRDLDGFIERHKRTGPL
jgi:excisionase family DNA binding protein